MSESGQEFARVGVEKLKFGGTRDIRESVVDELEERIKATGYSPDKPMRVVRENGHFNVGNGNHRLESLHRQDFDGTIPCVIEPEGTDIDEIALESNRDDTTFAEWDLFDYLDTIERKREDNTQAEIAEFLTDGDEEWSRSSVKQHVAVIDKVGTGILETRAAIKRGGYQRMVPRYRYLSSLNAGSVILACTTSRTRHTSSSGSWRGSF